MDTKQKQKPFMFNRFGMLRTNTFEKEKYKLKY